MPRKKSNDRIDLTSVFEKALRRAKKLERSLTKIVAQGEPGSALEDVLKSVQNGLATIRKESKAHKPKKRPNARAKKQEAATPRSKKDVAVIQKAERVEANAQAPKQSREN
ncbi:hypothetical protein [Microvirga rosea]|uniref:hypothetical protein n=1 Tax=Microvirga rosea TaxID=2715425 RepID=UPI001D0A42D8|nr:hypothetical protein [Microvirga rosea]MCB8822179.1 hypothetical protein [Microvirga rosea]